MFFAISEKRRQLRLKSYFEPYPHFSVVFAQIDEPLRLRFSQGSSAEALPKACLEVCTRLMQKTAADWIEAAILACALEWDTAHRAGKTFAIEDFHDYSQLREELTKEEIESRPDGDLESLWLKLRSEYFPERDDIDRYKVVWSQRRQTQSLATCSVRHQRVLVARAMQHEASQPYLEALLFHEMCHAYLGEPPIKNGKRVVHGKEFKQHESRHPGIGALNNWIKTGGWSSVVKQVEDN